MTTLEHLIQHYQIFSDGLPVKLKYAVPPKPKPPIPLFSTIPKIKRPKHEPELRPSRKELSADIDESGNVNSIGVFGRNKSDGNIKMTQLEQRNLSIPNDIMVHKDDGELVQESKTKNDLLNFRSLKKKTTKRNIIIEGINTLTRNKIKNKLKGSPGSISSTEKCNRQSGSSKQLQAAQNLMQNLSFSSDLLPIDTDPDQLYNIPKNNGSIDDTVVPNHSPPPIPSVSPHYFTESDKNINLEILPNLACRDMKDKDEEEIYFIDAPKRDVSISPLEEMEANNIMNNNDKTRLEHDNSNNNITFNSAGYVVSKSIPRFFDTPPTVASSQILTTPSPLSRLKPERLDSIISTSSQRSDSEFQTLLQHQCSVTSQISDTLPNSNNINCQDVGVDGKPNYFIEKDDLHLLEILGEGEFGSVYKGTISGFYNNIWTSEKLVAIKTLHDEHCKENRVEFLREASVMIRLRHHCIVQLIGISKGPPLMMVQELVPFGSMLNYLQQQTDKINPKFELKVWASQIACGMNFLESKHFVHRDLAARNILLASRNQAKISDFGLSRALGAGNDYYQASQGGKWPIKWYAPESFNFGTFSHSSDVWSFGITLWEMFTYGKPPYGDMKGVDVIKIIENGERLKKPDICPENIFNIMENCWNYNPKDRPTFRHLTEFFSNDTDYQNITELIQTENIS